MNDSGHLKLIIRASWAARQAGLDCNIQSAGDVVRARALAIMGVRRYVCMMLGLTAGIPAGDVKIYDAADDLIEVGAAWSERSLCDFLESHYNGHLPARIVLATGAELVL